MYTYNAQLVRVIDGDTVVLDVDLGFHVTLRETFRLAGINAFELRQPNGPAARQFVIDWFARHTVFTLDSAKPIKQEKYGRWLATITSDSSTLNLELIAAGLAVPYMT